MYLIVSIGKTIAQYRKLRDLTQAELGAKLDVHQTQIAHWEKERFKPRKEYLEKLSEALGITVDDLLSGSPQSLQDVDDPELKSLLLQVTRLSLKQRQALKTVMEDMLKVSRFQEMMDGKTQ